MQKFTEIAVLKKGRTLQGAGYGNFNNGGPQVRMGVGPFSSFTWLVKTSQKTASKSVNGPHCDSFKSTFANFTTTPIGRWYGKVWKG